jgi:hypothetical protein
MSVGNGKEALSSVGGGGLERGERKDKIYLCHEAKSLSCSIRLRYLETSPAMEDPSYRKNG